MGFFFANPLGLWALLGLPAVLAIHLLRRKSRQVRVSTLFLVERALPSNEGGRRLRRLRNSLPLWVQLLAVGVLALLWAQPRWIDQASTQTVVAVFDDSASLSAFREQTLAAAARELGRFENVSSRTQWIFLRSDASRLAAGASLAAVLAEAAKNWQPSLGSHDTVEAFRLARTLAGEKGIIVCFSDQSVEGLPAGVEWVAAGEPIDNAGFLGAEVQAGRWSALLKNFGSQSRTLRWRLAGREDWETVSLDAGAMTEISGEWPPGQDRLTLELEDDRFGFDNHLPLILPRRKSLSMALSGSEKFTLLLESLHRLAEPAAAASAARPDVALLVYNPLTPAHPEGAAMIFVEDSGEAQKPLSGALLAENHPLMENLNWHGLIARESFGFPLREDDAVLLWQGARPLIALRSGSGGPQLIFNFDVTKSNAARLPAFALLAHRFFSLVRSEKTAYEAANVETRQAVTVAGAGTTRAPAHPGFFSVKGPDGAVLFDGAAQFSDSRESDFRQASSGHSGEQAVETVRQAHARGEFLDPLWVLLLAALMFWNWLLTGAPPRQVQPA